MLWAITVLVIIADAVAFPADGWRQISAILYLASISIFSGLAAAWALRLGRSTLSLLSALMGLKLAESLAVFALNLVGPALLAGYDAYINVVLTGVDMIATAAVINLGYGARRSRRRRAAAILLALGGSMVAGTLADMDGVFWNLSAQVQPLLGRKALSTTADNAAPEIEDDRLWGAQPALIEADRSALQPSAAGRTNVYVMAVAGSGAQALFSREAHEALRVATLRFGAGVRGGALLSNGAVDLMRSPLATRSNIAAVAQAIGEKADHKRDLLFVYLASHGSPSAELASELPSDRPVQPISAATTAQALRGSGMARRVIVVSACYAATWIPALADDNTIVITAAAKDRTSFGCDDSRRLTVFGESFLGSLGAQNLSLHDAFEDAKRKIAFEERKDGATPSLPQAFVGRNMQALWLGRGPAALAPRT